MNHSLHPTLSMLRLYVAVVCVCTYLGGVAQSDLFISEYLEDGATKCIEIFNPTNTSITLTGSYRLRIGYNGAAPQTLRNLTGSIGPKQTIVACSSGSAYANFQVFTAGPNGNDVVLLEKDMSPIDIVGNIGCDPGAEWSSAGLSTQGMSLVRKGCINDGIGSDPPDPPCDFPTLATEWLGYTAGTSRLGSHDYLYGAISSTTVSPSFCGATDGSIEIIADGNGLEFSINGQAGPFTPTNSFSGLVAGTYDIYVRIAEDHSCFIQGEATLDEGPPIAIEDVHIQSPSDCGINDGMIEIVVNGNNLEYSIDDGATYQSDPIFTNLAPAIYEIAVRTITNSSCTTFGVVTLSAPIIPMIHSVSTTPVSDCAAVDGSALINATPFNLEYSIDNGQTWSLNSEFRNLTSGIYMVIVRNNSAPSCRDSKTITIDSPDYPEITLSDILHVDCKGKSNGSITTLTSGGSGSYHYTWSGPTAIGNTPSPIDLSAGDYSVTISDAAFNQCQDTIENIVITEPSTDPIRPQLTSLADVCELDEPIALNKTQDGITGSWSGPGVASNFFDPGGLNGMITLTFTPEEQWCASEANRSLSVMKAQIPGLMPISNLCITDDPVDLDDVQDGISGQWSGPGVVGNQFFPNGLDGKISLSFVVNAGQCAIDNDLAITVYALANPVLDPLPQLCENNPVIPLPTFQDGILGEWSGVGVQDNTFDPEGLSGTFNLTFQPLSSQCASQAAQPIVVGSSPVLSVTKNNPTCFGKANGSIVLSVSEGTVPYVIDWDIDGLGEYDDEENLSNLPAGRYIVSIKDQSNCIVSDTINLKHPEELSVIAEGKDESQKGAKDGEINLKVTGGSGPYTYLWSTGSTMSDLKNLANGSYSVTVTDRYDCISTTQVTIDFLSCTIPIQIVKTDLSCPQSNDGSIQVIANNAQEPVHYQWSKSNAPDTNQLQELEAGTYTLTVQDAQGCITNEEILIKAPDSLVNEIHFANVSAPGANDGWITVKTSGGTGPYTWQWSNGSTKDSIENLAPGPYSVTVSDHRGCQTETEINISDSECNMQISSTWSDPNCPGELEGMINVQVIGGVNPFQYHWSHDSTLNRSQASGLPVGLYSVTVEDNQGCTDSIMGNLTEPPALSLTILKSDSFPSNSTAFLHAMVHGGTPPYYYQWSDGATTADLESPVAEIYIVTITDSKGCQAIDSIQLDLLSCDFELTVDTDSVSCFGGKDGRASISLASGSVHSAVQWSHNPLYDALSADDLKAGPYLVVVVDSMGCQDSIRFEIKQPEALRLAFDAENETSPGAKDGYITVTSFGGTAPYTYLWNTGETSDSAGNLKPGTYSITVTDAHGCQWSRSTMINPAECTLLSNVSARPAACYGEASGQARLDITTLDFPVRIRWSHDSLLTRNVAENLLAGIYSVTITDSIGCQHIWSYSIGEPDSLRLEFEVMHQSEPGVDDGSVKMKISGGSPDYSIFWNISGQTDELDGLAPGVYSVTVVDANGCSVQDSVEVPASDHCRLQSEVSVIKSGCLTPSGQIKVNAINPRGEITYRWSITSQEGPAEMTNLAPGSYWVEIADENCVVRDTVEIEINNIRSISYNLDQSICNTTSNKLVLGAITGGQAPYLFKLDGRTIDPDEDLSLSMGTHILMLEDNQGCTFRDTFSAQDLNLLTVTGDTTITKGETINLVANLPGDLSDFNSSWQNRSGILCTNCSQVTIQPIESDIYIFTLNDNRGCRFEKKVNVTVTDHNLYYIPNVFTINGDGLNDNFVVYDGKNLIEEIVSLEVFDRRGLRIYHTSHLTANTEAPDFSKIMMEAIAPQIYIYQIIIKFRQGFQRTVTGDFMLLK